MRHNKWIFAATVMLLLIVAVYILYRYLPLRVTSEEMLIEYTDSLAGKEVPVLEYGIEVDSFITFSGNINKNQTLSLLLNEYHVPPVVVERTDRASRGIFDFRKLRHGRPYKIYCTRDTLQEVRYFVYEHSPVEYVKVEFSDPIRVEKQEKEVIIREKMAYGTISTSLWNAMMENQLDPVLAFELSEIYAWSIDFFGLQAGDHFRVIFNEHYVDSVYVGLGRVTGACFHHAGRPFYAIPFVQDSVESYFDQDGNSLRKQFLKAPLRFSRISSHYSHSRLHPILRIRRPHFGVDYAAAVGTPVLAIGDGRVTEVTYTKGAGRMIRIQHNSVYATAYLHLSGYAKGIAGGTWVKQGDVIGYVGSSGLSTGPHLDFRFYRNGAPVDPLRIEAPPTEPVREENRLRYDSVKAVVTSRLELVSAADSPLF